jgi:uncharacterized membrane protein YfcA
MDERRECLPIWNQAVRWEAIVNFDPWSLTIMAVALTAGAVVKGATGMGLPLVALPVLTAFFGLQHAVGLLTVPLIFTNVWQVWQFRAARSDGRLGFLPLFLVSGTIGIVLGTIALTSFPERVLVFTLGAILIAYVALRLAKPKLVIGPAPAKRLGPLAGLGAGILQGATGISSPIGVTFIHAMSLGREAHVFAVSTMFLLFAVVQLPTLMISGVMPIHWVIEGLLALLPIALFMPVGQSLAGRLSPRAFDQMILIFLGLVGAKMVLGV